MKRIILSAGFALAVLTFPTSALADSPICHDGILSDDVGQGCTNDGPYGGPPTAPSSSSSNYAICHDGILSDDVGQGCTNNGPYVSQTASASPPSPPSISYSGSGGYADVPGVPSSFASCVAMRESTNGAGSSNIYGIQGSGGQGSIAEQKQAFAQMYAARGTQPWSPYDGC